MHQLMERLAFGECMADLSLEMPVHTKDLRYDKRVIELAGNQVGEGIAIFIGSGTKWSNT